MNSGVINEDVDLAKVASVERSCSREIMGVEQEEPSFGYAHHSHSRRCDSVSHYRAARANARGLLGRDRDVGCHAGHSWRDADDLDRSDRRHRRRCVNWSARDKLLRGQICLPSRLRSFSSDCCRSWFVWRRLRITTPALRFPLSFSSRARLRRGPSRCTDSLRSRSASSWLWPWWRYGQNSDGFHRITPLSRASVTITRNSLRCFFFTNENDQRTVTRWRVDSDLLFTTGGSEAGRRLVTTFGLVTTRVVAPFARKPDEAKGELSPMSP